MGYTDVQTALSGIIQKIKGYDARNVVVDDYSVLARGNSSRAVILRRGLSEHEELTMGNPHNIQNTWGINAELYTASSPSGTELAAQAVAESQKIVDEIRKWPALDGTSGVLTADIDSVSEPEEGDFQGMRSRSKWWRQTIEVRVVEIVSVTRSE